MPIETGGVFGFLVLLLDIWAILNVAQSRAGSLSKVIWIAIILVLPLFGVIVWFFFGPKTHKND